MNPAFISTIMAPNFEIKEITSGTRRSIPQLKTSIDGPRAKGRIHIMLPTYQRQQSPYKHATHTSTGFHRSALHIPPMELMGMESVKCLLGVPMVGRNQHGYISPAFSGPHGGEKSIWLHHACFLGVPMVGRNQPSKEWMWWKRAKNG